MLLRLFILFFLTQSSNLLAQNIAYIDSEHYPMSTIFYLSGYQKNQIQNDTPWLQLPSIRSEEKLNFAFPDRSKNVVIIAHAPGASRYAHTWLVDELVKKDMIVVCIEHRLMNIHEVDYKELYSNVLARPVEIDFVIKQLRQDERFSQVIKDISLITFEDSALAALLQAKGHIDSRALQEHQKRYALWTLWGPLVSKNMTQIDWSRKVIFDSQENIEKYVLVAPQGKKCFYAQSLNKIKTPFLIVSYNRANMQNFHDEIEYLTTHLTESTLLEMPVDTDKDIIFNTCNKSFETVIHCRCFPNNHPKIGIQKDLAKQIAQYINPDKQVPPILDGQQSMNLEESKNTKEKEFQKLEDNPEEIIEQSS